MTHFAADEAATMAVAADLAPTLGPGDCVLLAGDLGAGKTTFARGILRAMGWTEAVPSPSYNLLVEYPLDPPVVHADLYRLANPEGLGLEDYAEDGITLIEWAEDRADEWVAQGVWRRVIRVSIQPHGEGRQIDID